MSRSEATQQKRFLVLDSQWQLEETIPLDIGPRHYNVHASDEQPVSLPQDVRPGDRSAHLLQRSTLITLMATTLDPLAMMRSVQQTTPYFMCTLSHMPHATCHMPHATCHMPHATQQHDQFAAGSGGLMVCCGSGQCHPEQRWWPWHLTSAVGLQCAMDCAQR